MRQADQSMQLKREACEKRAPPLPRLNATLCALCVIRIALLASACLATAGVTTRGDKLNSASALSPETQLCQPLLFTDMSTQAGTPQNKNFYTTSKQNNLA
ncbi:hypothetical protein DPMN_025510 [Dreissena polymorpha]|uniref:Uncharacterized protein n=1 Tax=Dreissena polymorpha TaxID=45954 RepID=A0A9D4RCL9_DREPO|nr:hypothetical protein DPMN_025510 [Dreissena polymorpha]